MLSDRARDALSLAILVGFTFMLAGTSKPGSSSPSPRPTPTPTPVSNGPITPETMVLQSDVNLILVSALARCASQGTHPACRILKDFEAAGSYTEFSPKVLWFGESIGVGGSGDSTREPFFVQVESAGGTMQGSARTLIVDNAAERKDSSDLLAASKAGRALPTSKAAAFMRTVPAPGGPLRLTRVGGRSVAFVETPVKTYVRRLGDRLLIVEHNGSLLGHDRTTLTANAWVAEAFIVR